MIKPFVRKRIRNSWRPLSFIILYSLDFLDLFYFDFLDFGNFFSEEGNKRSHSQEILLFEEYFTKNQNFETHKYKAYFEPEELHF